MSPRAWLCLVPLSCLLLTMALAGPGPAEAPGDRKVAQEKQPKTITNSIDMKLALIPAGKFKMGSTKEEQDAALKSLPAEDRKQNEPGIRVEGPQHNVVISKPFYMGVYEVTQKQYRQVMGKNPSEFSATGAGKDKVKGMNTDDFPVEGVSYAEAVAFCKKLSEVPKEKKAGRAYRLPTEAEWEYACRAGTSTPFHYGDSLSSREANFDGNFPYGKAKKGPNLERTCKVGSYKPNAWGLYDMHGNVYEWCADWYDQDYYKTSPKEDPKGPAKGKGRVVRGGSWNFDALNCRTASRNENPPDKTFGSVGFRVVCVTASKNP